MTHKENIMAVLECYFTGFKKEIIDSACNRILEQEPSGDAISRQEILNKINEVCFSEKWKGFRIDYGSNGQRDFLIDYIKQMLPVNPQPTGHWINIDDIESECSECGHREPNERFIFEDINFCAKCGAKMVEPQESEEV